MDPMKPGPCHWSKTYDSTNRDLPSRYDTGHVARHSITSPVVLAFSTRFKVTMAGLLDLPSELLFQIIHLIATSPLPNPSSGKRSQVSAPFFGRGTARRNTLCCPDLEQTGKPNLLNLLLTTSRLHSEVLLYTSKAPQSLRVDVAYLDGHWIWPTWRTIPCRSANSRLEEVELNILLCNNPEDSPLGTVWSRDRHPCRTLIQFFAPHGISITSFIINIDTSHAGHRETPLSQDVVPLREIRGLRHLEFGSLRPAMAQASTNYLHNLYVNAEDDMRTLQLRSIYEGIGKLVLCMDGKSQRVVRPDT